MGVGERKNRLYKANLQTHYHVSFQQVDAVIAASKSVTSSESFRKVLEVRVSLNKNIVSAKKKKEKKKKEKFSMKVCNIGCVLQLLVMNCLRSCWPSVTT